MTRNALYWIEARQPQPRAASMAIITFIVLPTPAAHIAASAKNLSRWFAIGMRLPRSIVAFLVAEWGLARPKDEEMGKQVARASALEVRGFLGA